MKFASLVIAIALYLSPFEARAARSMVFNGLPIMIHSGVVPSVLSVPVANGSPVVFALITTIQIVNVGAVGQTGSLQLAPGTNFHANLASATSVSSALAGHWSICGIDKSSLNFTTATNPAVIGEQRPGEVKWSVEGGYSTEVHAIAYMSGTYEPSARNFLNAELFPVYRVTINEDKGAVQLTYVAKLSNVLPVWDLCDGYTGYKNLGAVLFFPHFDSNMTVSFGVNGGRPL